MVQVQVQIQVQVKVQVQVQAQVQEWLDLYGSLLDLCGIHPAWSVGTSWAHLNCHRGAWGVQNTNKKYILFVFPQDTIFMRALALSTAFGQILLCC